MAITNELGVKIPLQIKILTPVHIGGNAVLSPLADYWIDETKNIHLVDGAALAGAMYEAGQTDRYIEQVKAVVTEKKGKVLQDFVRHTLQGEIKDFLGGISYKSFGIHNPVDIDCCIQTDGEAYIPGSSLKGALRSFILQNWLLSGKPESEKALEEFLQAVVIFSNRTDLRKNKQTSEIENVFREKAEEKLFGKLKDDKRLAASCLRVYDTGAVVNKEVSVYQLDRISILSGQSGKESIPVLKQCIDKNAELTTTVYIDYNTAHNKQYHAIFKDIAGKEQLFRMINGVSIELVNYELSVFNSQDADQRRFQNYTDFLNAMKERIKEAGGNKAYMRLGYGKMQFYQTIALAVFKKTGNDEQANDWISYLNYCDGLNGDIPAIYPATRVLTSAGEPMGWIELC